MASSVSGSLCDLTATQAVNLIRQRSLSPAELVRALLERIERVEQRVQAWETLDGERALGAAQAAERQGDGLPLHGVPFGVKDIYFTAGLRTTASFAPFSDFVPEMDAEAVGRLKRAGGIVLGKTVTTQFALIDPPRTANPWKLDRTPGGSSSGSAAAVAARMVPLALGTQTAGSVLRPAAYCGVVGFKPTFGRISRRGVFPLGWTLDTMGVICRSVEDAALALDLLAGHDPLDPASSREPVENYLASVQSRIAEPPRLGLLADYLERAQPEVRTHVQETARRLEQAGARIEEVRLPSGLELALAAHFIIIRVEMAEIHSHLLAEHKRDYGPRLRAAVEMGQLLPASGYVHALRIRRRFRAEVDVLLGGVDALLTPTAINVAPTRDTTGDPTLQAPWTMVGLPAISLPSGLSEEGLPLAIQLAGRRFQEARLLSVARWCEEALGPMPAPAL